MYGVGVHYVPLDWLRDIDRQTPPFQKPQKLTAPARFPGDRTSPKTPASFCACAFENKWLRCGSRSFSYFLLSWLFWLSRLSQHLLLSRRPIARTTSECSSCVTQELSQQTAWNDSAGNCTPKLWQQEQ